MAEITPEGWNLVLIETIQFGYACLLLLYALMEGVEKEAQRTLGGQRYLIRGLLHPVRLEIVPADN